MSQLPSKPQAVDDVPAIHTGPIAGTSRALSVRERIEALRRIQAQAEKRLRLGTKLFQAAETQTQQHRGAMREFKQEQEKAWDQMRKEMVQSIQQYDQWIASIERSASGRIEKLAERLAAMEAQWHSTQRKLEALLSRTEAMLDRARCWMESAGGSLRKATPAAPKADPPAPPAPAPAPAAAPPPAPVEAVAAPPAPAPVQAPATPPAAAAVDEPPLRESDVCLPANMFTDLLERMRQVPLEDSASDEPAATAQDTAQQPRQ